MKTFLSFLPFLQLIFTDVTSSEVQVSQIERHQVSSGINSCPFETISTNPVEQREDGLSSDKLPEVSYLASSPSENPLHQKVPQATIGGHIGRTQITTMEANTSRASKLRPEAEPYLPLIRGSMEPYVDARRKGEHPVFANPTVGLSALHQKSNVEAVRKLKVPIDDLENFSSVLEGFPKVQDLQTWFKTVVLDVEQKIPPHIRQKHRLPFMAQILPYKAAYRPLHGMRSIQENQKNEVLERGFQATFDFGRQVLNAYIEKNQNRLEHLLEKLMRNISGLQRITDYELDKLFFWSIILAAAKEWYYNEAAIFFRYLNILSLNSFKSLRSSDIEKISSSRFKSCEKISEDQLEAFRRVLLSGRNQEENMGNWSNFITQSYTKGEYHLINSRIEQVIYRLFGNEIADHKKDSTVIISQEKSSIYSQNWGLEHSQLQYLITMAKSSSQNRARYTMGYQLSRICLSDFSKRLFNLASHIAKVNGFKENYYSRKETGVMLCRIYDSL